MTGRNATITVLNGPNLNLLGRREPDLYGSTTLAEVEEMCRGAASDLGYDVEFRQSNHEGVLVDAIHDVRDTTAGLVVNAGAYAHSSVALRDALATVSAPVVEVHVTNVHAREQFRHTSHVAAVAAAVIAGCGPRGYVFAIQHVASLLAGPNAVAEGVRGVPA